MHFWPAPNQNFSEMAALFEESAEECVRNFEREFVGDEVKALLEAKTEEAQNLERLVRFAH